MIPALLALIVLGSIAVIVLRGRAAPPGHARHHDDDDDDDDDTLPDGRRLRRAPLRRTTGDRKK